MNKKSIKLLSALLLLVSLAEAAERYQDSQPHMGTVVTITLYADSPEKAQQAFFAAFRRIAQIEQILTDYNSQSELSRICQLNAPMSPELRTVIGASQKLSEVSQGAFDITVGPLSRLWRTARKEKRLPTDDEIQHALQRSGYQKLTVKDGVASCAVPDMQLDAGGIGKGYAGDEGLKVLREMGIRQALIAVSGDIVAGDAPPDRPGWRVKIPGEILTITNQAVSTSGDEFQFLEVEGVRYSHIFDPRTGQALKNSRTVTVIAKKGIDADSITKTVSVEGPEIADQLKANYDVKIIVY